MCRKMEVMRFSLLLQWNLSIWSDTDSLKEILCQIPNHLPLISKVKTE
jgi:hypothetical protein